MALFDSRQRSAYLAGLGGVAPHVQDRNRGQGLPSAVSDDGYSRMAAALGRRQANRQLVPLQERQASLEQEPPRFIGKRFARVEDVEKAGFRRVASGFYQEPTPAGGPRVAHPIWELRAAEDGADGYLLIRRREERAVDLRQGSGNAGPGTAAAVQAGIVRQARREEREAWSPAESYPINPGRDHRRAAPQHFLVSLLQVPGGDLAARKTIFSNEPMDLEALERLMGELKPGPMSVTHDTWTDGEWELRVRGPKGQLIHPYESVGPDEIGGAKGSALLDSLEAVIGGGAGAADDLGGLPPEAGEVLGGGPPPGMGAGPPPAAPGGGPEPPPEGEAMAPPPPAGAPLAPSAAALRRGQKVLVIRQGQIADAVVLMVNPQQQAVEVMFGGGGQGQVPMGDVLDSGIDIGGDPMEMGFDVGLEMEDGGGSDDGMNLESDSGGDAGDALVEITADDLPVSSSPGGAGQDPFDVEVLPASEEPPLEYIGEPGYENQGEDGPPDQGGYSQDSQDSQDYDRAAARYLTACMHRYAVDFMGGFRPGVRLESTHDFTSHYQGIPIPAGTELTVEGFHHPEQDPFIGYNNLQDPIPGGEPYENLRIRLESDDGQLVLITPQELEQQFEFARGDIPGGPTTNFDDDTERFERDMPALPPGELDVDPYGDTVLSKPQQPAGRPTMPARPPAGSGPKTIITRPPSQRGPQQHGGY